MAFGNYNYNPYVNPYVSPYNPAQTQFSNSPMPTYPQAGQGASAAPQTPQNGFVWVDGIEEANSFYVAPNNAVQLWDKNAPTIYKKSADSTGKPSMQIFDLVERKEEKPTEMPPKIDYSEFVKRDELSALEDRIASLEAKKRPAKAKEVVEDDA